MLTLDSPITALATIKPQTLARLKHIDIETIGDMLRHFPARYEDYSRVIPIAEAAKGEAVSFEGVIAETQSSRSFQKKLPLTTLILKDAAGDSVRAIWFNQPFLAQTFTVGMHIRLSGKVEYDKNGLLLKSPAWEFASREHTHTAGLVPVYPETLGVTSKFFRWQIELVFKKRLAIPDPIPTELLEKLHLPALGRAFKMIHRPESENDFLVARKRFAFDEMFFMQLRALRVKNRWDTEQSCSIPVDTIARETFLKQLPFTLTDAQQHAIDTIALDLAKPQPMNRLLNGDVGSGKTIVAAVSMLQVAGTGFQAVLLAPTEVLARQHFESLRALFAGQPFEVALLTANYQFLGNETVKRETLVNAIRQGIPRVIIATHALLQKDIRFDNLALVIVDEQHRFGVNQRAYLQQNIERIHTDVTPTHVDGKLLYEDLTYKIRGAIFSVKKQLGLGHKEVIYQKALVEEFQSVGLNFNREKSIDINYNNKKIGLYRPDFVIESKIIVELKALPFLGKFEKQQVWHYLKGSQYPLALLVNFGRDDIQIERFIHTSGPHESASSPHKSAPVPHFLTMTATPIPRTLALAFFGNLDVSLLNEMPAKRIPIVTKVARNQADRNLVYHFIRSEIKKGRQAFIILPLVETSEKLVDIKAAVAEHERLSKDIFPDLKLGLLHGKVKAKDKETIMTDFKNRKYDILVATAVIEVGIDIPNASVILIEEADRFGLAQLHQFRGRVGRGEHPSYCFLFPGLNSSSENARLAALEKTSNGFELAEADLKLRGPGSLFGARQSGLSDLAMANLGNLRLVTIARNEADILLQQDPKLSQHPLLHSTLATFDKQIHLE